MHRLTHLNGIRAFEAAARHKSFALAAQELNVTPAAVGQQVRQLEDWLGIKLFVRSQSGQSRLTLTPEAETALPEFQQGLAHLTQGLDLLKSPGSEQVTLALSPSIASKWLMPKLAEFQQRYPDTSLNIDTSIQLMDYQAAGIDIGIRYGQGDWPALDSCLLMKERVFPVCAPELQHQGLSDPAQLADYPILYDMSVANNPAYPSWQSWHQSQQLAQPKLNGLKINSSADLIDAAIRGQGVALGREVLVSEDIQSGNLVCPFGTDSFWMTSEMAYYLVWPENKPITRVVELLKEWLIEQAQLTPKYCEAHSKSD
ncbi:LysR substrate-binding domain-containing protein [Shewanella submarina]|uniref:LysR substrate-binding domain-containing protein n=1 Tax=Shewanella submarina TaxID=2016376 RepID=A0ABV7GCJ6_9GAMM|nr:LysR substrate-binding domain-containing protein [Shewanella submarina]MCL1037425.1 LysR substrate-binding domain-containing protein [Shewanella submarina]